MLRSYRLMWLRSDLVAGLVLTAVLVPAGMGYAEAAGVPPITGLYATIVSLVVYARFGPSRILVLGPDSSFAPLIAAAVLPLAAPVRHNVQGWLPKWHIWGLRVSHSDCATRPRLTDCLLEPYSSRTPSGSRTFIVALRSAEGSRSRRRHR